MEPDQDDCTGNDLHNYLAYCLRTCHERAVQNQSNIVNQAITAFYTCPNITDLELPEIDENESTAEETTTEQPTSAHFTENPKFSTEVGPNDNCPLKISRIQSKPNESISTKLVFRTKVI